MKNAKDVATLKAVSQNLMHENISVTDGIYGILSQIDVQEHISMLGNEQKKQMTCDTELLVSIANRILEKFGADSEKMNLSECHLMQAK